MLLPGWDSTTFVWAEPAFLLLVAALAVVLEGGEGDCNPGSPVSKIRINNSNHIPALRFTTKMLLPGWDSTTTFVWADPAFLPPVPSPYSGCLGGRRG